MTDQAIQRLLRTLKPCPFCGTTESLDIQHLEGTTLHPSYRIHCGHCGTSSRYTENEHTLAALWNTRKLPQLADLITRVAAQHEAAAHNARTLADRWHGGYCEAYFENRRALEDLHKTLTS